MIKIRSELVKYQSLLFLLDRRTMLYIIGLLRVRRIGYE